MVETPSEQLASTGTDFDCTDRTLLLGVYHGDHVVGQRVQECGAHLGPDHCLVAIRRYV